MPQLRSSGDHSRGRRVSACPAFWAPRRGTLALALALAGCSGPVPRTETLAELRARAPTQLTVRGPSLEAREPAPTPRGAELVRYPSGELNLAAWLALPADASAEHPAPAIVYFHGGFALEAEDFELLRPYLAAGYAVLTPMLRGENGNPGAQELYWGELDDALAAGRWLAARPDIDARAVYGFGHSAGGVIAALLSLCEDSPYRLTGSAGGTTDERLFSLLDQVPFARGRPSELALRVFSPNADLMRSPHVAYVGAQDWLSTMGAALARRQAAAAGRPLTVVEVRGDHVNSLPGALRGFGERVADDLRAVHTR